MLLPDGAFRDPSILFITLIFTVSAGTVPPVTNVSVSCSNLQTTVSWSYSGERASTRFRVEVNGSDGNLVDETSDCHFDLTPFVWSSEGNYLGFHYVTITVLQGGAKSQPAQSPTFTFNAVTHAHVTCVLDFPPLDVVADASGTAVAFDNPLLFYGELREARKQESVFVFFNVSSSLHQGDFSSECLLSQPVCRQDLPPSDGQQDCVTLTGGLYHGNRVEYVLFQRTQRICSTERNDGYMLMLALMLTAFLVIIVVVTVSICAVKAWTLKPVPEPILDPLVPKGLAYQPMTREEFSPVSVVGMAVDDDDDDDDHVGRGSSPCGAEGGSGQGVQGGQGGGGGERGGDHLTLYTDGGLLENSDQELEAGLISSGHGTDEDSATRSEGREFVSLGEEEEEEGEGAGTVPEGSHYDRPHAGAQSPESEAEN